MRVLCIYRKNQDYTGRVEDWLEDFYRQTGQRLETMNPDADPRFCELHDVTNYPAFVALDNNGTSVAKWQGPSLPAFNDVAFYLLS